MSHGTREHCKGVTDLFAYRAITFCGGSFLKPSAKVVICNSSTRPQPGLTASHNPVKATPAGYRTFTVWADPRSLAATDGIAIAFSSWGY